MATLFPLEPDQQHVPKIPGIAYKRQFITPEEEAALVTAIDAQPLETSWERRR